MLSKEKNDYEEDEDDNMVMNYQYDEDGVPTKQTMGFTEMNVMDNGNKFRLNPEADEFKSSNIFAKINNHNTNHNVNDILDINH